MQTSSRPAWHDIVAALVASIAAEQAGVADPGLSGPYDDLTDFVLRQHHRMGGGLREALAAATVGFDLCGLRRGARFHRLAPDAQGRQVAAWKKSPRAFQRDLVRFYESLVAVGLHSREQPAAAAPPAPEAGQAGVVGEPPDEMSCEIAVIGSGPGGSITACLLAEAGRQVLLIEEGPFLPLESCPPFSTREMEQKYRNGGLTVAFGPTKIAYAEGRCVGGGTEINSGLYHRTPPEVLAAWRREFQVEALGDADLLPHFEACERDVSVSPPAQPVAAASRALHEGAERLGWKSLEVPRWFRPEAGAPPGGARQSMTRTYLPRFLAAGGRLLPLTGVTSLGRDGSRWQLRARHGGRGALRIAAETVFCCAGAVHTPALLRRSGLTRHIGDSLRLHPTVKLVARFPGEINAPGQGVPGRQVKEFAPRLSLGCAISTPPLLAVGLLDHPDAARRVSHDWPHLAAYYAAITGGGSGTVRVLPGIRDPLVRYRLAPADYGDLADGLSRLAEAMFAAGAGEIYPTLPGCRVLRSPGDLGKLPQTLPVGGAGLMTVHLFSSCPMGENRQKCPVDSFGKVRGADNLFIADASLLCGAPGVNPQGSIMAIARRNARHFLGQA